MAIKLDPNNADYYFCRGEAKVILATRGIPPGQQLSETVRMELNGAIADYTKAVQLDGNLSEAYKSRERAELAIGDTAGAKKDGIRANMHQPVTPQ